MFTILEQNKGAEFDKNNSEFKLNKPKEAKFYKPS